MIFKVQEKKIHAKYAKEIVSVLIGFVLIFCLMPTDVLAEDEPIADQFMGTPVQKITYTPYVEISDEESLATAQSTVFSYATGQLETNVDKRMYGVSIDFTQSDKVVVDVNQTWIGGCNIKVYDSQENVVAQDSTPPRTDSYYAASSANRGLIVLDSSTLSSGNYYVEISTTSESFRTVGNITATTFRLLVGDERNYDYYRYGRENGTHIAKYKTFAFYDEVLGCGNFISSCPTTRMTEEYYTFTAEERTSILLRTNDSWIQYRIEDPVTGEVLIDTTDYVQSLKTEFLGEFPLSFNYKVSNAADNLNLVNGKDYNLVVYSINPNKFGTYSQRNTDNVYYLSVGDPMMIGGTTNDRRTISITGQSISNKANKYSAYVTIPLNDTTVPRTAMLDKIELYSTTSGTRFYTIREIYNTANNKRFTTTAITRAATIECNPTGNNFTPVNGEWKFRYKSSQAVNVTPVIYLHYTYEYGN